MTDKERLENIKFLRNSEKTVAPGMQPSELISRKDVDWLINRVEELERELEEHKSKFTVEYTMSLRKQNKRYREALELIKLKTLDIKGNKDTRPFQIYGIASDALEGEE